MADDFSKSVLRLVTGQICQAIGWHSIQSTPLNILVDLLQRYMVEMGKVAHRYAEHGNRTNIAMPDLARAFDELGISASELEDYVQHVESTPLPNRVPAYPVRKDSNLNFLKPGSREVVLRPIYIHDHLPAMYPEASAEEPSAPGPSEPGPSTVNGVVEPGETKPSTSVFKKPEPPSSSEPSNRRIRFEDASSRSIMREISSVMMTTGGFISPAREGKLPESRAQFWLGKGPFMDDSSDDEDRPPATSSEKPSTVPQRSEQPPSIQDGIENVKPGRGFIPSRAKVLPPGPVNPLFRSFEFGEDDGLPAHISPLIPREQKVLERTAVVAAARARIPFKKGPREGGPLPPPLMKRPPAAMLKKLKHPMPPVNVLANKKKNSAIGTKFSSLAGLPKIRKKEAPRRRPGRPKSPKAMNGRGASPPMPALIPKKVLLVDAELSGQEVPPSLAPPPLVPRSALEERDVKPIIPPPIRHPPPPPRSPSPPPRQPTPPPPPAPAVAEKPQFVPDAVRTPVAPTRPPPKLKKKRKLAESAEKQPRPKKKKISPPEVPPASTVKLKTAAVIDMKPSSGIKRRKITKAPVPKGKTPAFIATSSSSDEDDGPPSRRAMTPVSVEKKEVVKSRTPSPPPKKRTPSPPVVVKLVEEVKVEPKVERIPSPVPPSPPSPLSPVSPEIDEQPKPSASLFSSVFSKLPAHPSFIPNFLPKAAPPPFGGPPSFPSHPSFIPFGGNAFGGPSGERDEDKSPSPPPAFLPAPTPPPVSVSRNSMMSDSAGPLRPESALSHSSVSRPNTPAVVSASQKKLKDLSSGEKEKKKQKKKEKKEKEREEKRKKEAESKKEKKEKKKKQKALVFDGERSAALVQEEQETRSVPKLTLKLGNADLSPNRDRSPLKSPVPPPVVVPPAPVRVAATHVAPPPSTMPTMPKITIKPIKKPEPPVLKRKEPPPPVVAPAVPAPTPVKAKKPKKSKPAKVKDTSPKTLAAPTPQVPPATVKTPGHPSKAHAAPVKTPATGKASAAPTKTPPAPTKTPTVPSKTTAPTKTPPAPVKTPTVPPKASTVPSKTPAATPKAPAATPKTPAATTKTPAPPTPAASVLAPKPRGRGRPSKSSMVVSTPSPGPTPAAVTPVMLPAPAVALAAGAARKVEKAGKSKKDGSAAALITETVGRYVDEHGNTIWICPTCGRVDDGTPMIGCDTCDDWYHWICVGVVEEPPEHEKWYCPRCLAKERGLGKSKSRKKAA